MGENTGKSLGMQWENEAESSILHKTTMAQSRAALLPRQ